MNSKQLTYVYLLQRGFVSASKITINSATAILQALEFWMLQFWISMPQYFGQSTKRAAS